MRLVPETNPLPRLLVFPLLLLAAFGVFWLRRWPDLVLHAAHCPLNDTLGIPCPTCGGTHAATAAARLDFPEAFAANPLVAVAIVVFTLWAVYAVGATLVPPLRRSLDLGPGEKKAARILTAFVILAGWAWQFAR